MSYMLALLFTLMPTIALAQKTLSYADRAKDAFTRLDVNNLQVVDEFYDKNMEFHDPITTVKGRESMRSYYKKMYQDLSAIKFEYRDVVTEGKTVALIWTMTYATKKLKDGEMIKVEGMSHIKFGGAEDKVVYHRDYFDVGAMVYEHVPVLGWGVRKLKAKLGEH